MNSLVCITTCNRLKEVKKYIWDYISFCNTNEDFDFLLSLDGNNEEYIMFCDKYQIPLLYSDEREGVGLSKNRVIKQFPEYDFYFFIEDDIELIKQTIFNDYINASEIFKLEHLNHFGLSAYKHNFINTIEKNNLHLVSKNAGGGYFNFFTKAGLDMVGGFHPIFSKYKRFGHTEHTLRYVNTGLQKYSFNSILECQKDLLIHFPPHVTPIDNIDFVDNISTIEKEIIDQKLKHFPLQTISSYHYNCKNMKFNNHVTEFLLRNKRKYPLTKGRERRKALSEYFFFKFNSHRSIIAIFYLILSFCFYPCHPDFKHYFKVKLSRNE